MCEEPREESAPAMLPVAVVGTGVAAAAISAGLAAVAAEAPSIAAYLATLVPPGLISFTAVGGTMTLSMLVTWRIKVRFFPDPVPYPVRARAVVVEEPRQELIEPSRAALPPGRAADWPSDDELYAARIRHALPRRVEEP